jgi:hypothetical protein
LSAEFLNKFPEAFENILEVFLLVSTPGNKSFGPSPLFSDWPLSNKLVYLLLKSDGALVVGILLNNPGV